MRDFISIRNGGSVIMVFRDRVLVKNATYRDQILPAIAGRFISNGVYEPRAWVKRYFSYLGKWRDTLRIFLKHKMFSSPNYLTNAVRKLRSWGSTKKAFFTIASAIFERNIPYLNEGYKRLQAHLNWLAAIISGNEPIFRDIGQAKSLIENPKLPVIIKSREMALLLGIISGDGSFYRVRSRGKEKLTLAIINTRKEFLEWAHHVINQVFGFVKPSVYKVTENKFQYRYCNSLITESLIVAGAHLGKKSMDFNMPEWIKRNNDYTAIWFRGLLESDGNLKIDFKKRDISVRYSRNIVIKLPKYIAEEIMREGSFIERTHQYALPRTRLSLDIRNIPRIIKDEAEAIEKITGKPPTINVERIFYNKTSGATTANWVVSTFGKHALRFLLITKPPRLIKKLQEHYPSIINKQEHLNDLILFHKNDFTS